MTSRRFLYLLALLAGFSSASSQDTQLPNSFPHNYPGQPSGDFGPAWQSYFQVTEKLTNVTFTTPGRSFAGNIPVQRAGHPNNTLFFWSFEKSNGSLTDTKNSDPWGIWLNGGPGSTSMYGMFYENGPIRIGNDFSASANNHSWNKLADYFWIDQPVGVGFSTADAEGYIASEDQMGEDFMGFLGNLVKVFPSLATRPLHITGESYAGTYIPYIMKTYFGMSNPPVKIAKIAIGDGTMTAGPVFELLPTLTLIETYPQLIGYDPEVYKYFKEQSDLCGFNINLTYPQQGIISSVDLITSTEREVPFTYLRKGFSKHEFFSELTRRSESASSKSLSRRDRELSRELWKRDLIGRPNGTIDPWYGCVLLIELIDYAINFTFPYTNFDTTFDFNVYDIPDATNPPAPQDATFFMNDNRTRAALHAPTSKDFEMTFEFPFGNLTVDPSPEPMTFLTELATNASSKDVSIIFFSGNNDALVSHRGTEIAIQNTTFGGIQGFTRKPSTPWKNDAGEFAGIVHQERNWTYVLFYGAGHLVPATQPISAFTFLREFILGNNSTGSVVQSPNGQVTVVGGENSTLAANALPGDDGIIYGSGSATSTFVFPSATRAAWKTFIQSETATTASLSANAQRNDARRSTAYSSLFVPIATFFAWML